MRSIRRLQLVAGVLVGAGVSARAVASFTTTTNFADWQAAVPGFTTIDFVGIQGYIHDTYAPLGVVFDANDFGLALPTAPDGWAASGSGGGGAFIQPQFFDDQFALGIFFIGAVDVRLYSNGALLFESGTVATFGPWKFLGITSTIGFDFVQIEDPEDGVVAIDNLYFGGAVPAPGVAVTVGIASLLGFGPRRRR
ncbi:MAG: hypothetical protein U0575_09565 [Phycisphaerales bacterium]